jgi:2-phospho-L-lactate guanylyltransferase
VSIWAIVPVKPLADAKSRLAGRLDPEEREALGRALLLSTLRCLRAVDGLAATLVVSPDTVVLELAEGEKIRTLTEALPGDLNRALTEAAGAAQAAGAEAIVVVPIDLPLARPGDIASAVALVEVAAPQAVVVVPDRHGEGTNLLGLRPPNAIPFAFGPGSLERHRAAALARGIPFHTLQNPRLAFDLDEPADLALGRSLDGGELAAVLQE